MLYNLSRVLFRKYLDNIAQQKWHFSSKKRSFSLFWLILKIESSIFTAWKVSKYGVISGPNTGKYEPEITPYLDTFHAVFHYVLRVAVPKSGCKFCLDKSLSCYTVVDMFVSPGVF